MPRPNPVAHVGRRQYAYSWDPAIPPIATVESGAIVEFDLLDSSAGQLRPESRSADLLSLDFGRLDQIHGPIAVDGARPGDVLEIEFLRLQPGPFGWTANIPGFGLLADEYPEPAYRVTALKGGSEAEFLPGIRVPIAPFCGVVGVAPSAGPLPTIPPDRHGGNMDTRHLTKGSRLFLPVFQPGGLLSLGDGHAAQGDGEVCGTAIECEMRATVRVSLRREFSIQAPEFITSGTAANATSGPSYATDGIGPDLREAARDAIRRMIDRLVRDHGLARVDAYMLCSVAADLRISEIADVPNFLVTAYCPVSIFA